MKIDCDIGFRGYCARRVRRIRKSLGFTHIHKGVLKHSAKFIPRKLAFNTVTEERYSRTFACFMSIYSTVELFLRIIKSKSGFCK